jgi:hypothetical protein
MRPCILAEGRAPASIIFLQDGLQLVLPRGDLLESNLEPLTDHLLVSAVGDLEFAKGCFQLPLRDREMFPRFRDALLKLRAEFGWNGMPSLEKPCL